MCFLVQAACSRAKEAGLKLYWSHSVSEGPGGTPAPDSVQCIPCIREDHGRTGRLRAAEGDSDDSELEDLVRVGTGQGKARVFAGDQLEYVRSQSHCGSHRKEGGRATSASTGL